MVKELDASNKSKEEILAKCDEIVSSLSRFNRAAKHEVVSSLYHSFISSCREAGIEFIEIDVDVDKGKK